MRPNPPRLSLEHLESLLSQRLAGYEERLPKLPHPSLLHDGMRGSARVAEAIRHGEKITIVGDYDVDGVVSSAIMRLFFDRIGYRVEVIIPNRFQDGYGLSPSLLDRIDADVIISVDNGISAVGAAQVCRERGIDLIITDHHTPPVILPQAYAIINPKQSTCAYPLKEICGAQVAWLFLGLLKHDLGLGLDMREFFPFLALAIIADVMPLVGINRTMVRTGLEMMQRSSLPPFVVLREAMGIIDSESIAFQIAPRLNSAGRMEDASIALEFLLASEYTAAHSALERLNTLNTMRKQTEAFTTAEAMRYVDPTHQIIVVAGEGWNEGVVGIVASRLASLYERPAIVLSIHDGIAKGSGRSVGEVDLFALIETQRPLLMAFGGHTMAAGLSISLEHLGTFTEAINAHAKELDPSLFVTHPPILGELSFEQLTPALCTLLERYEPYGEANPRPIFLLRDAPIQQTYYFGAEKNHTKFLLQPSLEALAFGQVIPEQKRLSCLHSVSKNVFQGRTSVQLMIEKIL